LAACFLNVI